MSNPPLFTFQTRPMGRLVVITDATANPATMALFEHICSVWPVPAGRVCVVTGFSAPAVLKVTTRWRHLFFDPMNFNKLEVAAALLPWAEVWIVGAGQVWSLRAEEVQPVVRAA